VKSESIYLYGPPGCGKTSVGRDLADALALPFLDVDELIEDRAGRRIVEIFDEEGEDGFRGRERDALDSVVGRGVGVVALGGGALLAAESRARVLGSGEVVVLDARREDLLTRLGDETAARPLLAGDPAARLDRILQERSEHYRSFDHLIDTSGQSREETVREIQVSVGAFRVTGMGDPYDVRVRTGSLTGLGAAMLRRDLRGPVALVSDSHVGPLHGDRAERSLAESGYAVQRVDLPAGEEHKVPATVESLWAAFLEAGLERGSTVVALGGGVIGDLAGFGAATFLRGVRWVVAPTSLLAMVDASLGGKTGANLSAGKNLVGSFHAPSLILTDPGLLDTLPSAELRGGLAEVIKHGVISDPALFQRCAAGPDAIAADPEGLVRRAMAVKIRVIQDDPFEVGPREALNVGHTIGHAVEKASDYHLSHGEAVAIGLVAEARLAERAGIACRQGLARRIEDALASHGLPTAIPSRIRTEAVVAALGFDKKRSGGAVRFALPADIGTVRIGVELSESVVIASLAGRG
jgi:3-dehydroquinate synthase